MSIQWNVERKDGVAIARFSSGRKMNALDAEFGPVFSNGLAALAVDESLTAIVLGGAEGVFSAGGDLAMLRWLTTVGEREAVEFMGRFYRWYLQVLYCPLPVIAAVEGAAVGAGLCLATACDGAVVSEDATLAFNFAELNLHPGMGASLLVPRRVGTSASFDWLFSGRRISPREALDAGLIQEVSPPTTAIDRAFERARRWSIGGATYCRALKASLRVESQLLDAALDGEARAQAKAYGSEVFRKRIGR